MNHGTGGIQRVSDWGMPRGIGTITLPRNWIREGPVGGHSQQFGSEFCKKVLLWCWRSKPTARVSVCGLCCCWSAQN